MCTVVVRRSAAGISQILALRDELTTRPFDEPGLWWPEFPDALGGRDQLAGGTWCASRADTGVTALVLNRPQRPIAGPGAPSRGVLPLLAVAHGVDWPAHLDVAGMASFALVLVTPDGMTSWFFDGTALTATPHGDGTHMITSGGPESRKTERYQPAFAAADFPDGWRDLVRAETPADDPSALLVRHEKEGRVFATVFAQLIQATPGRLHLEHTREPWIDRPWQHTEVTAPPPR